MTCINKNCKVKNNLNREGLCPSCDQFWNDMSRRKDHQGRQQHAREASRDSRRNLGAGQQVDPTPPTPQQGLPTGPPPLDPAHYPPVDVNVANFAQAYNDMKNGGAQATPESTNNLLVDIYGMMVNLTAKQSEIDTVKTVVRDNTSRIDELEAKIGDPKQVSIPLSIAIRKLPLPPQGTTEIQQVRRVLDEVKAEGVNTDRDVVKAVREGFKAETRPGANDGWLGTVLVEIKSDEKKTKIMKTKKCLENHHNQILKNLIIKNAKTKAEMRMERMANSLLKMNHEGQNYYFAANGNLRPRNQPYQNSQTYYNQPQNNSRYPHNNQPPPPPSFRYPAYSQNHPQVTQPNSLYDQLAPRPAQNYHQPAPQAQTNVNPTQGPTNPPPRPTYNPMFSASGPNSSNQQQPGQHSQQQHGRTSGPPMFSTLDPTQVQQQWGNGHQHPQSSGTTMFSEPVPGTSGLQQQQQQFSQPQQGQSPNLQGFQFGSDVDSDDDQ